MRPAFLLALLALPVAAAQIYKCPDGNGRTIYQQAPCPDGKGGTVKIKPATKGFSAATDGERRELERLRTAREEDLLEREERMREAAATQPQCLNTDKRRMVSKGMSEAQIMADLGPPDRREIAGVSAVADSAQVDRILIWQPCGEDQSATTIMIRGGRVVDVYRETIMR